MLPCDCRPKHLKKILIVHTTKASLRNNLNFLPLTKHTKGFSRQATTGKKTRDTTP